MAEAFLYSIIHSAAVQPAHFFLQTFVLLEAVRILFLEQFLHLQRILPGAHTVIHCHRQGVQPAQGFHYLPCVIRAAVVRFAEIRDEFGYLPPLIDIHIDISRINSVFLGEDEGPLFVPPVDDILCAFSWMPVDIVCPVDPEDE